MTFESLGLNPQILKSLSEAGYTAPTPVQEQAIPAAIAGRDLLVSSQTGSGKTAAFMLPALHKLTDLPPEAPQGKTPNQAAQSARSRGERPRFKAAQPKMLVLTPTRELALQVTTATENMAVACAACKQSPSSVACPTLNRCNCFRAILKFWSPRPVV